MYQAPIGQAASAARSGIGASNALSPVQWQSQAHSQAPARRHHAGGQRHPWIRRIAGWTHARGGACVNADKRTRPLQTQTPHAGPASTQTKTCASPTRAFFAPSRSHRAIGVTPFIAALRARAGSGAGRNRLTAGAAFLQAMEQAHSAHPQIAAWTQDRGALIQNPDQRQVRRERTSQDE